MIILAPLHGYTDFIFRNVYSRHYQGIDTSMSPFISMTQGLKGYPIVAKDVNPINNHDMPVIPQLIGNNPEHFIQMADFLRGWDYNQLNWNLGCPMRNIARKKRGSGILPYPDLLREILEKTIPMISQKLSVKIRLGYKDTGEIFEIIKVLNDFPLENITIHPRIGIQMYEGEIHHEVLKEILPIFKHEVIYNGDIFSFEDFLKIKSQYPTIKKWMIGRGIFYNPMLPDKIKGKKIPDSNKARELFKLFILDLYGELQKYKPDQTVVNKIKDLWLLLKKNFVEEEKVFWIISHIHSVQEMKDITLKLIEEEQMIF
ncbi:MAG: tRNA-dihydrouridine synthase family protein [Bacteroidetes bacterium]|nr:tRNA-dihydrouridine synthase family protein [Bacteroidota bacterium]